MCYGFQEYTYSHDTPSTPIVSGSMTTMSILYHYNNYICLQATMSMEVNGVACYDYIYLAAGGRGVTNWFDLIRECPPGVFILPGGSLSPSVQVNMPPPPT